MMNDMISVGEPLPRIKAVHPSEGYRVKLEWLGGRVTEINLAPAVLSHRHFMPLRDEPEAFRQARVNEDGNAICWPGGIELTAEWIARLPETAMPTDEFRAIMDRRHLSLEGMAALLEISRRQVAAFRGGKPIPAHIALATRYVDEHVGGAI